jgi:Dolichyl-phosphate-mannose-protein mannosyltransferase
LNISFKTISSRNIAYGFVGLYFILNVFQVYFTELTSDEGYYWYLSTHLNWGYYDHPPMLAFLINIGCHLFAGELGVRFANVLLISISLVFLFKLLEKDGELQSHLYLIILSLPLFNYLSVIVFPDTPLIAFSMLYLYFYKQFLERGGALHAILMGILLSAMLYSKYHAILFVLFVIVSNFSLLRNRKFIFSLLFALLLFVPHLFWQYKHDFVTFKYQLFGRSQGFKIDFLTEYPSVQFLVLCPALIFVPFIYKTRDGFERTLKYIVVGTQSFFLLSTLRGYVQFHWTSLVLFPLIILAYRYYSTRKKKLFLYLTMPTLLLVAFLRLYLAVGILPVNTFNHIDYFHGRQAWANDIRTIAGDKPVVFENQLREAPLYAFYSGKQSVAMYGGENKKTQYQIWNVEDQLQGKDVVIIKDGNCKGCTKLVTRMGKEINYLLYPHFVSYQNIRISVKSVTPISEENTHVQFEIFNHRNSTLSFSDNIFGEPLRLQCKMHANAGKNDTALTLREMSAKDSIAPHSIGVVEPKISFDDLKLHGRMCSFGFTDGIFGLSSNSKEHVL